MTMRRCPARPAARQTVLAAARPPVLAAARPTVLAAARSAVLAAALAAAGALLLGGCAGTATTVHRTARHADATPAVVASAPGGTPLASRTLSGGMCAEGPCGSGISVRVDGSYEAWERGDQVTGRLEEDELRTLVAALPATHLQVTRKVERSCPSATDAPDLTVRYLDPQSGRQVRVSSCDYTFGNDALVSALAHLEDRLTSAGRPRR